MKAILLKDFGGPEMMFLGDTERPVAGINQVLIKVAATSVNRPDVIQPRLCNRIFKRRT